MTHHAEYPEVFARFYDVIYAGLRTAIDQKYFLDEIVGTRGRVLEIGTGTGRIFAEALNGSADIYGLDISAAMVERLKAKIPAAHHGRLWVQDAVKMTVPYKFALIIAPFRVFSHLLEVKEQLECLDKVWEHLEPGGRFIFDLYVPDLKMLLNGMDRVTDFDGEYESGKRLRRVVSMRADLINQISRVRMEFLWDEGGEEHQASWDCDLRFFFRWELEHLIQRSKLTLETIYGDYRRGGLNENSKDFVVICRKGNDNGARGRWRPDGALHGSRWAAATHGPQAANGSVSPGTGT